jgi:MFS family permease
LAPSRGDSRYSIVIPTHGHTHAATLPRHLLTPLIIATAGFMENLDATVIATSLPAIAQDLGVNPIALTCHLVSLAVLIPISGWMTERFGTRRVFRAAIVVFTTGSLLCALSSSLAGFVAARFVQGMGGAALAQTAKQGGCSCGA